MYSTLLLFHSFVRWIVLVLIVYAIYRSFIGYTKGCKFTKSDNSLRHWTATIAHIQLMIGMVLYTQSAIAKAYWSPSDHMLGDFEPTFFGLIHIGLMLISIVVLTIGSAMAKRKLSDREKFKTMLIWFIIALIIIFIAIPWPFSPLTQRPYLRAF